MGPVRSVRRAVVAALLTAAIAAAACADGRVSVGPLSMEVPRDWHVTSTGGDNLQLADGTTGGATGTAAGTATAVFDVYVNSEVTPEKYTEDLRAQNVGVKTETISVDGYEAVRLSYSGEAAAGRQEAVFVPEWRIRIVYRAAFPNDDAAFLRGRSAFRRAVGSIAFSGRPPRA